MAKYLITGGAGFIGSHLAQALVERGDTVRILDNLASGKVRNLAGLPQEAVEFVQGDLRDVTTVNKVTRGVSGIFHQGAAASVPRSIAEPAFTNDVNVTGTLNVLLAARAEKVRVVMASSSSVYGDSEILPKVETMAIQPKSPYALQKASGELYARMFFPLYGVETVCLRYFNIFGPRQDPQSEYAAVIPKFITRMLNGEAPTINGDGSQSRDFTFVDNAVQANLKAMSAPVAACGQAYNVGCGERFTLNQLIAGINEILSTKIEAKFGSFRAGDVKHSLADITAARQALSYTPLVPFKDGLHRTVEWFRSAEQF